jgi:5-methylcytosine-specific restriction endonuclease McrA
MQPNRLHQTLNFARKFGPERCVNTATGPNQSDRARIKMTDAPINGNPPAIQEIISRADAKARGLKRYFTGLPCKHGHVAQSMVSNRRCCVCLRAGKLAWDAANPEKVKATSLQTREKAKPKKSEYDKIYREKNGNKLAEYRAAYYVENREQLLAKDKQWRDENAVVHRARSRRWYHENIDRARERNRKQKRDNPEKVNALNAKRRAIKRGAEGVHTADEINALFAKQNGKCAFCFCSIKKGYHVDHVVPLIRGGSNWISNIQLLCQPCNNRKHAKDPIKFAQENGRLL